MYINYVQIIAHYGVRTTSAEEGSHQPGHYTAGEFWGAAQRYPVVHGPTVNSSQVGSEVALDGYGPFCIVKWIDVWKV